MAEAIYRKPTPSGDWWAQIVGNSAFGTVAAGAKVLARTVFAKQAWEPEVGDKVYGTNEVWGTVSAVTSDETNYTLTLTVP